MTEKKLIWIAVLGLVIIVGLVWANLYGLNPNLDQSSAEAVATSFCQNFSAANNAGFMNRPDRAAYDLLTPEAKAALDAKEGSLISRLSEFAGGALPPSEIEIYQIKEQGDKAEASFFWQYADGTPTVKKTVFLTRVGDIWQVYSVVNAQD